MGLSLRDSTAGEDALGTAGVTRTHRSLYDLAREAKLPGPGAKGVRGAASRLDEGERGGQVQHNASNRRFDASTELDQTLAKRPYRVPYHADVVTAGAPAYSTVTLLARFLG